MTALDRARAAFKAAPSERSAADLLTQAIKAWKDTGPESIVDADLEDEVILVRDWLGRYRA